MKNKDIQFDPPDDALALDSDMLKKAREGDSFAQLDIGQAYFSTTLLTDNYEKAFYWLTLAAEQRNMQAQFMLGDLYALGKGVGKNEFTAYDWYIKSAIQSYPKALTRLHNLYHAEKSMYTRGQRDSAEEKWAQPKFKEENHIRELYEYRVQRLESEMTKIKQYFAERLNTCRKQENEEAHLTLGFLYQHGYGIRKITSRAIEFYTRAAEKGNTDAQYNLGSIYHHHSDMKWNYREAFKWYTQAAEGGSSHGQYGLGCLYQKGLGVDTDYAKAIELYTLAAKSRNLYAQISLACIFRKGDIVQQDYTKAAEWYKEAITEGSKVAQDCLDLLNCSSILPIGTDDDEKNKLVEKEPFKVYSKTGLCSKLRKDIENLSESVESNELKRLKQLAMNALRSDANSMLQVGKKYCEGDQFTQDKDTGFRWILRAAKAKFIEAQCIVAKMYKDGDCVEQDYLKASIWYSRAAKKRDNKARFHLGQMFYQGLGVRKDPLEASRWYTFAAEKENSDAQRELGVLREKGEGLRKDITDAIGWYMKSVKQKDPEAIYRLGRMYKKGNGMKPNFQQVMFLYEKAAHLGNLNAQLKLAKLHSDEDESYFDTKKAFNYYEMASNQKHPEAKYRLAILYLDGNGVDQDFIRAHHLFKESKDLHYHNAENIFHIPIDYSKNDDIDYEKLATMFTLVCQIGLDSLEYNLGYYYEFGAEYNYNTNDYKIDSNIPLAKHWYDISASHSDPKAQYRLGVILEEDKGSLQDLTKAVEYYKKAQINGNIDATYRLAYMYLDGYGVSQDFTKAFNLFVEAYNMGDSKSIYVLSISGSSIKDSKHKNVKRMLEEIAHSGNIPIQYQLGLLNLESGSLEHVKEAIKCFSMASDRGYIDASYQLGLLYEEGVYVEQNYQEAFRLYQIAADKGKEDALFQLARLYHCGKGVKLDYLKAFELYSLAAEYGNQLAQLAICVSSASTWEDQKKNLKNFINDFILKYDECLQMWEYVAENVDIIMQFELGKIFEEMESDLNLARAKYWYCKGVASSYSPSLFRLGRLYELSVGTEQGCLKAIELFEKAAKSGDADALHRLGVIYQNGNAVETDPIKAFDCYRNAAQKGNQEAQFVLGTLYEKGDLTTINYLEAFKWFTAAASQNNEKAYSCLNGLIDSIDFHVSFCYKRFCLISKLTDDSRYIEQRDSSFLGAVHYQLGCMFYYGLGTSTNYEKAWSSFKSSAQYGERGAMGLMTIQSGYIDYSMKKDYLKKLEMLETIVQHLQSEEIYELGVIYYRGVYANSDDQELNKTIVIVNIDYIKASKYFERITERKLTDVKEHYGASSYYLGMVHYVATKHEMFDSKAVYYLTNASNCGYTDANDILKVVNDESNTETFKNVIKWHLENKDLQNLRLMCNIGWMYNEGFGVDKNYSQAFKYYNVAADQEDSDAQFELGYLYEHGQGVERDYSEAIKWYKKAAEQSHTVANYNLGEIYSNGRGVDKDYSQAFKYYNVAADQEDSDAQFELGYLYEHGQGVERDYSEAIKWYKKAAEQNDTVANYNLGEIYSNGRGVEKDYSQAFKYYNVAADQEDSDAQFKLGYLYEHGQGVEKDYSEAIKWYKKAVEQSHTVANYNLGEIYSNDQSTDKDYSQAFKYYKVAAEKGHSGAQFQLGYLYEQGHGVEEDYTEAIKWFKKAAEQNHDVANYNLGDMYYDGRGVDKDYNLAFKYYKVAFEQEYSDAQFKVGYCYFYGNGINREKDRGLKLMSGCSNKNDSQLCSLGEVYHSAGPKYQDFSKAMEFYQKISDGIQHSHALRDIGLIYEHGDGVDQSYQEALTFYQQSADRNNKGAYYNIALLYYYGNGVVKDYATSFRWFYKIILEEVNDNCTYVCVQVKNNNDTTQIHTDKQKKYSLEPESFIYGDAHYYLSIMFEKGQGTSVDLDKAAEHLQLAISYGSERGKCHFKSRGVLEAHQSGLDDNFGDSEVTVNE